MRAGTLRETVVVEYPVETQNALGESVQTWEPFAIRRASVTAVSYSETIRRQQPGGEASHIVRCRFIPGVRGSMRLRWQSRCDRILYIAGVVEHGNRQEHELSCEERA